MNEVVSLATWLGKALENAESAWEASQPHLVNAWNALPDLETKDYLTVGGILITFCFSCANFRRTTQALNGTKANNRASRFEVVHGPILNEASKEINEITREIAIGKISLADLPGAHTFFRDKIRPRVIKAEHMVVNEISRIGKSDLTKNKTAWHDVSNSAHWDEINEKSVHILTAQHLDVALAHLEVMRTNLLQVGEAIETVRSTENMI